MADLTYTVRVDCHRCGETTTMAGVKPTPIVGGGDLVNIAVHCDRCGADGGYAVERRRLIGQPDYIANVDMAHGWSAARIAIASEIVAGTERAPDVVATRIVPPMADEWSKPVKGPYGWSVGGGETKLGLFWDGDLVIRDDDYGSPTAPRDVVLRLLAAEASDRLGWVWEVGKNEAGHLRARCYPDASKEPASDWGAWSAWGPRGEATFQIAYWNAELTGDALIALAHGRFLLQDALREAGQ
jgi:hypothetical protein